MTRCQFKPHRCGRRARHAKYCNHHIRLLHGPFAAEHDGYKSPTEDRHQIIHTADISVLCVFDGHGGQAVSDFVNRILPGRIYDRVKSQTDADVIARILQEEFLKMNAEIYAKCTGCTGTVSVVSPTHIITCHVGDSPAILFQSTLLQSTTDHNCSNAAEIERMRIANNPFTNHYTASLLAVSRSFGDKGHPGVIAEGQISIWQRPKNAYLAVLSDSFTEALKDEPHLHISAYLTREDIVEELLESLRATTTLKEAVQRAVNRRVEKFHINGKYCGDNTTLILYKI